MKQNRFAAGAAVVKMGRTLLRLSLPPDKYQIQFTSAQLGYAKQLLHHIPLARQCPALGAISASMGYSVNEWLMSGTSKRLVFNSWISQELPGKYDQQIVGGCQI